MKKKDRTTKDKKALEVKMQRLRVLTTEQLADVAGGNAACPLFSCQVSCGGASAEY